MKLGINPYLFFDGRCREAMQFYARVLGGEIAFLMRYGEAPVDMREEKGRGDDAPVDWSDKVMHASLKVGDQVIMGGDAPPRHQLKPQGFSISLTVSSVADAEHAFTGLADGGSVYMPLSETFFSERFGMLTDRYGIAWMVNFPGAVEARNADARARPASSKPAAGGTAVSPASGKPRSAARKKS